jgi:hypothetical protein
VLPAGLVATSALALSSVGWGAPDAPSIQQTAQRVSRDLTAAGYEVERGYPMLYTPEDCERFTFPIMLNCYGNDPDSPYVILALRAWPDEFVDPALVNAFGRTRRGYSATYRLDPREAIVVLAELPPPGGYVGLQTWVFSKEWLTQDEPWDPVSYGTVQALAPDLVGYLFGTVPGNPARIVSFSSVNNNINHVTIERQSGTAFGETRYFIITPDRAMDQAVRSALALAGVPGEDVFTSPIPLQDPVGDIGPIGLDATANDFTTFIRYKHPDSERAAHAWRAKLPLTVLRVRERPSSDRPPEPFPPFVPEERSAAPEGVYADDFEDLVRQICERWGQPCDPDNPDEHAQPLIDLRVDLHSFGPECRAIGMNCLGDNQDASYFLAPGHALDPGWVYTLVGTLGTATGNATYAALSVNDLSKLKGVLSVSHTALAGSATSYAGPVQNTDKFFVHYLARDCEAIQDLTDGQCSTITEEMVPPLGEGAQGLFTPGVRAYVRPGSERGPLSTEQLRPWIIRFTQP